MIDDLYLVVSYRYASARSHATYVQLTVRTEMYKTCAPDIIIGMQQIPLAQFVAPLVKGLPMWVTGYINDTGEETGFGAIGFNHNVNNLYSAMSRASHLLPKASMRYTHQLKEVIADGLPFERSVMICQELGL